MRVLAFLSAAASLAAWAYGQQPYVYQDPFANAPYQGAANMPPPPRGGTTVTQTTGDATIYNNPYTNVDQSNSANPINAINNPNFATSGSNSIGRAGSVGGGAGVLNGNQIVFNANANNNDQRPYPQPYPYYPPNNGPSYPPNNGPSYPPHNGPSYPPHNGPSYPPHNGPSYPPHNGPSYPPHNGPSHGYPRDDYSDYTSDPNSPYWEGTCDYNGNMCLNGGTCVDGAYYAQQMTGGGYGYGSSNGPSYGSSNGPSYGSSNGPSYGSSYGSGMGVTNSDAAERELSAAYNGGMTTAASSPYMYPNPYHTGHPNKRWAACRCAGNWYGKYCENRRCDNTQMCSNEPLVLSVPRNVQVECGSDLSATASGTGAAFATDNCRGTHVSVNDKYESGPQKCVESVRLRRTFTGRDRCGATAMGNQMVTVVDTTPPKVTARLVPLPPLAVSASPITLTPEQTKRLLKILLELAVFAKKGLIKTPILGVGLLPGLEGFQSNDPGNDISGILKELMGRDLSSLAMSDVFDRETADLLSRNGFDLSSISSVLNSDPMLSGAGQPVSRSHSSSGSSLSSGSSGVGLANLGSLLNSNDPLSSLLGGVRAVQVPNDNKPDHFKDFLHSNVALPVGVQTCSQPSTRVFAIHCSAQDRCTPGKRLRAAARLRVTRITDRRQIDVDRVLDKFDPKLMVALKDPMTHKPLFDHKLKFDPKVMMKPHDPFQQHNDQDKKHRDDKDMHHDDKDKRHDDMRHDNQRNQLMRPYAAGDSQDLSQLQGNYRMDYDSVMADAYNNGYNNVNGAMTHGGNLARMNNHNNDYRNDHYGSSNGPSYGSSNGPSYGHGQSSNGPSHGQSHDQSQSHEWLDEHRGTTVLAAQCHTKVEYVNVYCGDTVSITLDAEDACLADRFDQNNHHWITEHEFKHSDFSGNMKDEMKKHGFSDTSNAWLSSTSWKTKAVRGTSVELEVLAEDECQNVGRATDNPALDCEVFVAGRCCPPVTNALSQFAKDRVLNDAFGNDPLAAHKFAPTIQLGLEDLKNLGNLIKK